MITSIFHCPDNKISIGMRVDGTDAMVSFAFQGQEAFNRKRAYTMCVIRLKRRPIQIGLYEANPHILFGQIRQFIRNLTPRREAKYVPDMLDLYLNLDRMPF